jgi:hypothetical protein
MHLPTRPDPLPLGPRLEAAAVEVLRAPPRPPRDPALFTSNVLFGEPGIYPAGPPMEPASGDPADEHLARAGLATLLPDHLGSPEAVSEALALYDGPTLHRLAPAVLPRAALVVLCATAAAPALAAVAAGRAGRAGTPFDGVTVAAMPDSGRVVGPAPDGPPGARALNDRYAAEHPAVVAPSLAHDLLWSGDGHDQYEEACLHAVLAMVHLQVIARSPWIAHLGTELTRRQNSLAVTLANSRHPGSAALAVRADDGPGTIPGGDPSMQTPDFWSIPFAGGPVTDRPAPPALTEVLAGVAAEPGAVPDPLRYDDALSGFLAKDLGRQWLSVAEQLRVGVALGLVDLADVAAAAGLAPDDAVRAFGLAAAQACWTR